MPTPILKSYDCAEHDPLEQWIPQDPKNVSFWMNCTLGTEDVGAADNFLIHIRTTQNTCDHDPKKQCIVLDSYSFAQVLDKIQTILQQCQGDNWLEITKKLSTYFYHEYENYTL